LPSSSLGHRFVAGVNEPTTGSDEGKSSHTIFPRQNACLKQP